MSAAARVEAVVIAMIVRFLDRRCERGRLVAGAPMARALSEKRTSRLSAKAGHEKHSSATTRWCVVKPQTIDAAPDTSRIVVNVVDDDPAQRSIATPS
jgi:hypothetical protein